MAIRGGNTTVAKGGESEARERERQRPGERDMTGEILGSTRLDLTLPILWVPLISGILEIERPPPILMF